MMPFWEKFKKKLKYWEDYVTFPFDTLAEIGPMQKYLHKYIDEMFAKTWIELQIRTYAESMSNGYDNWKK